MCRPWWPFLLLWTVWSSNLRGQSLERVTSGTDTLAELARLARLRTRADSLLQEWRQASTQADLVDSVDRARVWAMGDTIAVGALRIVTNRSPLPLRDAANRIWPLLDSLYGVAASQLADQPLFVVAVDPDTTVERPVTRNALTIPWDLDGRALTVLLLANIPPLRADPTLITWLGGLVRPSVYPERQRARVYVELVTAPSEAARRCFLRDFEGCKRALALTDSPDRILEWYPTPGERRAVVNRALSTLSRGARGQVFHSCTAGNDSACREVLRSVPREAVPPPLPSEARQTLLDVALRLGGRRAYDDLMASRGAFVADRLSAAAGVPIDSVLAIWRRQIDASRPRPVRLPPWDVWIAFGWSTFFAVLALRSSRWRVS